ncbi:MAG: hypothetical protein PUP91_06670 [Rhizonema sp. PD37]|nr:hypothetical protein [Rhizonema sp. PD37]
MPDTDNTTNVTIEISRSNQFTPVLLQAMIQRISFGNLP